jgi:hypothetical protein
MNTKRGSDSLLFNVYNGMLVGSFIGSWGLSLDSTRDRYPALRKRLAEFSMLSNIPLELPDNFKGFKEKHVNIVTNYMELLGKKNSDLLPYVLLGASFVEYCVQKLFGNNEICQMSWDTIQNVFKTNNIPKVDIDELADKVEKKDQGISINSLHSAALNFVQKIIEPLPEEENTAFVAMSFSEPYDSRYSIFYRPLLIKYGYESIRSWGGLSNEIYYDVMLTLIEKCGRILIDLSDPKPNVMYEFGLAHGQGKIVYPILESSVDYPLSNIHGQAIGIYDTNDSDNWVEDAIEKCGFTIAAINIVIEKRRSGETGKA